MNLVDRSLIFFFFFCQVASYLKKIKCVKYQRPSCIVSYKFKNGFFLRLHPIYPNLHVSHHIFINFTLPPLLFLPFSTSPTLCYVTRIPIVVIFRVYIIAVSYDLQKFSPLLSHSWSNDEYWREKFFKKFLLQDNKKNFTIGISLKKR